MKVHAVVEKRGRWYIGYIPEAPGVNAQERTLKATRESLVIALKELANLDPDAMLGANKRIEEIEVTVDGKAA